VGQDSPAALAGLRVGDWIQEIDNLPIKGVEDLIFAIGKTSVGSTVQLTIERNGHRNQVDVVIGERPDIR
jgi:serine protease Do